MSHKFDASRAAELEKSDREQLIPPFQILTAAGLKSGMVMADIGCGGGFFTLPAAAIVGEQGQVWAVDISEKMLSRLREKNPPVNVTICQSQENSIPIPDDSVDFVLVSSVFHEAEQPQVFIQEIKRIMKTSAKLVLIDFEKITEEIGPPFTDRIAKEDAEAMLVESRFKIQSIKSISQSHYQIIAEKDERAN